MRMRKYLIRCFVTLVWCLVKCEGASILVNTTTEFASTAVIGGTTEINLIRINKPNLTTTEYFNQTSTIPSVTRDKEIKMVANVTENHLMEATTDVTTSTTSKRVNLTDIGENAQASKFFPKWVPFEKDIHELGDFVKAKVKPKKRLALPVNFVLQTPVETDNYFSNNSTDDNNTEEVELKDDDVKIYLNKTSSTNKENIVETTSTEPPTTTTESPEKEQEEEVDPEVLKQREIEKIREEQIKQAKLAEVDALKLKHQEEAQKIIKSLSRHSSEEYDEDDSESSEELPADSDYYDDASEEEPYPKRIHPRGVNISESPEKIILNSVLNNSTGQIELINATEFESEEPDAMASDPAKAAAVQEIVGDTQVDAVSDAAASASGHAKEKHKPSSYKEGGGKEHFDAKHSEYGEHGKKAYAGHHDEAKAEKGHHDKEYHEGHYDDNGGHDKHHHDESDHYGKHHHHEGGKKHAEYEESGKHSKGHSTKGSHDIHKKDEYEKKVEFFEEDGDDGFEEKLGGYGSEHSHEEGGKFGKGKLDAAHDGEHHGKKGHHSESGHKEHYKGHSNGAGGDHHHESHHKHGLKESKSAGSKWSHHKGGPAKIIRLAPVESVQSSQIIGLRPPPIVYYV